MSIEGVCTDTPFRDRKLRRYRRFCNVIKYRFGVTFDPMPQADWSAIVEAAILRKAVRHERGCFAHSQHRAGLHRARLSVVPISHKQKAPKIKAWEKLNITADNAAKFFNGADQNIGVQLGARSKGLTDVDLDCAEAVRLAPHFLPPTNAVFGRASKPSSHYLYNIGDAPEKATEQLKDENKQTIIELRMGGGSAAAQTVFPGSTHPSGETIQWVTRRAARLPTRGSNPMASHKPKPDSHRAAPPEAAS